METIDPTFVSGRCGRSGWVIQIRLSGNSLSHNYGCRALSISSISKRLCKAITGATCHLCDSSRDCPEKGSFGAFQNKASSSSSYDPAACGLLPFCSVTYSENDMLFRWLTVPKRVFCVSGCEGRNLSLRSFNFVQ